MSALEAFLSTWSRAREAFGEGMPQDGAQYDNSAQLRRLQSDVQSATSDSAWTGTGAEQYATENRRHAAALGAMAGLDRRLAVEVDRSAAVVAAGRRDMDAVKQWVVDAAATVPRTAAGDRMLWPVVSKGAGDVANILARSNGELATIAGRIRELGGEYGELDKPKRDADVEPVNFDGERTAEEAEIPETTLDLADIVYRNPDELGDPGMMELAPHSGVWVPDPNSRFYKPTPVQAPLDLDDIKYYGPGEKGQPWEMELIPGSGAWVPDPNHPSYRPQIPQTPVDLAEIQLVDPDALVPRHMVELWPHAGILIPNPDAGRPF